MIALNLYTYIDTVILGLMRTDAEVGWYAASYHVYEGLTYAPSILAAVLTPRLSYLFAHDRSAHRGLLMRALAASLALGIVLGGVGRVAGGSDHGDALRQPVRPAVLPLQILAGGALFVFGTWILHAAAISTSLDRRLLVTTIVGLGANVALNIVFIPRWGISGAAWATVLAEALTVVLLFVQVSVGCATSDLRARRSPAVLDRRRRAFCFLRVLLSGRRVEPELPLRARARDPRAPHALDRCLPRRNRRSRAVARPLLLGQGTWRVAPCADSGGRGSCRELRRRDRPESDAGVAWTSYVATVLTSGAFTVAAALSVLWLSLFWGYSRGAALFAATAYAVASPAWCYATLFMGHAVTAGCLAIAFAATVALGHAPTGESSTFGVGDRVVLRLRGRLRVSCRGAGPVHRDPARW